MSIGVTDYHIGNESFIVMGKQTAVNTPIVPTVYIPTLEQSDNVNINNTPDGSMRGTKHGDFRTLNGLHEYKVGFKSYAEPYSLARMMALHFAVVTTGGGPTYTHTADEGEASWFTIDVVRGNEVKRFVDVKGSQAVLAVENDMNLSWSSECLASHVFYQAELAAALTAGAKTGFTLKTSSTSRPAYGLTATTAVQILDDNGTWVEFVMTGATITDTAASGATGGTFPTGAAIGNAVRIKVPTPSFANIQNPFNVSNSLFGFNAAIATAITNAGARTTAGKVRSGFTFTFNQEVISEGRAGYQGPGFLGTGKGENTAETEETYDTYSAVPKDYLYRNSGALAMISTATDNTAWSLKVQFPNLNLMGDPVEPVGQGDLVIVKRNYTSLQDTSAGYRTRLILVNSLSAL